MVSRTKIETIRMPVAAAIPSIVKAARIGWRVMLRSVIMNGCETKRARLKRAGNKLAEARWRGRLHRDRRRKLHHIAQRPNGAQRCGQQAQGQGDDIKVRVLGKHQEWKMKDSRRKTG